MDFIHPTGFTELQLPNYQILHEKRNEKKWFGQIKQIFGVKEDVETMFVNGNVLNDDSQNPLFG